MRNASWTAAALYRAVWRWHFYAGLICAPFLVVLAVTGAIYLFNDEINDLVYPDLRHVPPSANAVPLEQMAASALAAYPGGKVTRIDTPGAAGRSSVEVFVAPAQGEPRRVFVDPGTGRVLGSYVYTRTLVGFADVAHGSLMLGTFGDAIVELAACWGFILTVTGLYLWWPRGGRRIAGAILPRWNTRGRAFWKEWHAAVGAWTAILVMFLVLTGLPWANIWGDLLRRGIDVAGIGYPASHRGHGVSVTSAATVKQATDGAGPWTTEKAPVPRSDAHEHHHEASALPPAAARPVGLDRVAEVAAAQGLTAPYRLNLPRDASGTYIVFTYPDQPEGQRTLYVDQYSGRVLGDVRFADYGIGAKAVELGVQLHMGNYFGRLNQIVMLLPCLAIVFLAITGPYMWWRRRPKGGLAAPKAIAAPSMRTLALIVVATSLAFPLAGASLAICLLVDRLVQTG